MEAMTAHGILPQRSGVLVHDCWAPYWKLDDAEHALCTAHLLRELLYVKELTGHEWPQAMTHFLLRANQLCRAARHSGQRFNEVDIAAFTTIYNAIIDEGEAFHPEVELPIWKGGRAKQSVACNLLRRFRKHADAILLFICDLAVPFINNVAERAVRMPKVKQKISGCFRTVEGADNFCVIRSKSWVFKNGSHVNYHHARVYFAVDEVTANGIEVVLRDTLIAKREA